MYLHQKFLSPSKKNMSVDSQASIYTKLLLPLKCLAYGAPPHCYCLLVPTYKGTCKCLLQRVRQSRKTSVCKRIVATSKSYRFEHHNGAAQGSAWIHRNVYCSYTYRKNCFIAWQGSYNGKRRCQRLYWKPYH
jgi:hypothetical protein